MTGFNKKKFRKYRKLWEDSYNKVKNHPDFKAFCPRRYKVPEGWYDPMVMQITGVAVTKKVDQVQAGIINEEIRFNEDVTSKVMMMLKKFRVPNYFVDRDLMKLINMSKIADSIDLSKIKYPFDACMFTMPVGEVKEVGSTGEYVSHICYARTFDIQTLEQINYARSHYTQETEGRIYSGEFSLAWSRTLEIEDLGERKKAQKELLTIQELKRGQPIRVVPSFNVACLYTDGALSSVSFPITEGEKFGELMNRYKYEIDYDTDSEGFVRKESKLKMTREEWSLKDSEQLQWLSKLAVSFILYMSARASEWDREEPSLPKVNSRKGKKVKQSLASPNWLGKKYRGQVNKLNKLHGDFRQEPHWRSGYLGTRWVGKGRTEEREVWVMPYPVNIEEAA